MDKIFTCLGASNHSDGERQIDDYYATGPKAAKLLLEVEPELNNIWECACGGGHLAKVFDEHNKLNKATDLFNRGYGMQEDFLNNLNINFNPDYVYNGDIVTNPPYKYALEFVQQALKIIATGRKVCMFLKLTFLEGKERKEFFKENPPKKIYVCSSRINCAKDGDFIKYTSNNAICFAWFVWEKGYKGYPIIQWIN